MGFGFLEVLVMGVVKWSVVVSRICWDRCCDGFGWLWLAKFHWCFWENELGLVAFVFKYVDSSCDFLWFWWGHYTCYFGFISGLVSMEGVYKLPRSKNQKLEKSLEKPEKSFTKRNSGLTRTKNHPFFVRGSRLHSPLILGVSFEMMQACTGFHGFVGCGSSPCSFRRIWPWGWLLLAEGILHPQRAQTKKISLIYSLEV